MASWNGSRGVIAHRDHSGGTSRPPLPRPANGDNVRPVPLWEREFCRNAYDFPWETFCINKRFIEVLFKKVMDWDDSGALESFKEAKERFRAKYHGKPVEDPVLDPNMYIDEVDHLCEVDPKLVADVDKIAGLELVADMAWGGMANLAPAMAWGGQAPHLVPPGWGEPDPNVIPTGWGEPDPNVTPTGWGEEANPTQENQVLGVVGAGGPCNDWRQQGVVPGQASSGTGGKLIGGARMWSRDTRGGGAMKWSGGGGRTGNGGRGGGRLWNVGGGGGVRGSTWNGGGRGNSRNQGEGQHHQQRNSGGRQRHLDEGRPPQVRSGRFQQQQQQPQGYQRGRKMEWRPVQQHNRAPKEDDPAA